MPGTVAGSFSPEVRDQKSASGPVGPTASASRRLLRVRDRREVRRQTIDDRKQTTDDGRQWAGGSKKGETAQ
jgi:hypothetical protein